MIWDNNVDSKRAVPPHTPGAVLPPPACRHRVRRPGPRGSVRSLRIEGAGLDRNEGIALDGVHREDLVGGIAELIERHMATDAVDVRLLDRIDHVLEAGTTEVPSADDLLQRIDDHV